MNQHDYMVYSTGYRDAAGGACLSDDPYGGRDGLTWRRGVKAWLQEHAETGESTKVGK